MFPVLKLPPPPGAVLLVQWYEEALAKVLQLGWKNDIWLNVSNFTRLLYGIDAADPVIDAADS